jgi:hypothetical protein
VVRATELERDVVMKVFMHERRVVALAIRMVLGVKFYPHTHFRATA